MCNPSNSFTVDISDYIPELIRPETKEKLLILAEFLPSVSEDHFDMDVFYSYKNLGLSDFKSLPDLGSCGTVGCAAGWAATIPSFQEQGLTMSLNKNIVFKTPEGDFLLHGFDAVKAFFGISEELALFLFTPEAYVDDDDDDNETVTKDMVIERLTRIANLESWNSVEFDEHYLESNQIMMEG